MKTKVCAKCKKRKNISEFGKKSSSSDGLKRVCKNCLKKQRMEYRLKYPYKEWASQTLYRKRRKNYKINISANELAELAKQTIYCPLCNRKLKWGFGNKKGRPQYNSPSLDRKNNEKFLNKDNVWIICWRCNTAKFEDSIENFINYCRTIISNYYSSNIF